MVNEIRCQEGIEVWSPNTEIRGADLQEPAPHTEPISEERGEIGLPAAVQPPKGEEPKKELRRSPSARSERYGKDPHKSAKPLPAQTGGRTLTGPGPFSRFPTYEPPKRQRVKRTWLSAFGEESDSR